MSPLFSKETLTQIRLHKERSIFVFIVFILVIVNLTSLLRTVELLQAKRERIPFIFLGFKFAGLESIFQDIPYVGYYTNKSLDNPEHAAQFAQAQYLLTPTILDLDYKKHEFILFDCTSEDVAFAKMQSMRATPLKRNKFGIILARQNVWN